MISTSSWTPSETIQNANLSVGTVDAMATALLSALSYWNEALDRELRRQTRLWVTGPMADDLDLVRHKKPKSTTYEADVQIAIAAIWDPNASASFKTFRVRFYGTMILNLLVVNTGGSERSYQRGRRRRAASF